jgi:hypothetical protein
MSDARVRLRPNRTAATRSAELETVTSWRLRFDSNKWVAAMAVVKGRNETNSRSISLLPGRHVQFQDKQGNSDREDAIGERLKTASGQKEVPIIYSTSRRGADRSAAQFPPY